MSEYVFDLSSFESDNIDDGLREEIVRCRDCKYYEPPSMGHRECSVCRHLGIGGAFYVKPDYFCAWAERKECGDE